MSVQHAPEPTAESGRGGPSPTPSNIAAGDEFYHAWVSIHEGGVSLDLWVITSVRAGKAHATRKTKWTWVKVSTTNGDYGWASNIDRFDREAFDLAKGPPSDWAKTKAAAYTKALPALNAIIGKLTQTRAQLLRQRTKQRSRLKRRDGAGRAPRPLAPVDDAHGLNKNDGAE